MAKVKLVRKKKDAKKEETVKTETGAASEIKTVDNTEAIASLIRVGNVDAIASLFHAGLAKTFLHESARAISSITPIPGGVMQEMASAPSAESVKHLLMYVRRLEDGLRNASNHCVDQAASCQKMASQFETAAIKKTTTEATAADEFNARVEEEIANRVRDKKLFTKQYSALNPLGGRERVGERERKSFL